MPKDLWVWDEDAGRLDELDDEPSKPKVPKGSIHRIRVPIVNIRLRVLPMDAQDVPECDRLDDANK